MAAITSDFPSFMSRTNCPDYIRKVDRRGSEFVFVCERDVVVDAALEEF